MKATALDSALLPQYQSSDAFMERFLEAAHESGSAIERSENTRGIKLVDGEEMDADAFTYFEENKERMRSEFYAELAAKIGEQQAKEFCETVAVDWYDGARKRKSGRPQRLKRSVYEYLCVTFGAACKNPVQRTFELANVTPLISTQAVEDILCLNEQFLQKYIHGWMSQHANCLFLDQSDVYLRRGLALDKLIDVAAGYTEWDYVNSYSIAISAPEKFAQMYEGKVPAIVSGELDLFQGRVLFFSPFLPGMALGQLEFGIIPSKKPLPILHQGEHGNVGIHEYLLDPPSYLTDNDS